MTTAYDRISNDEQFESVPLGSVLDEKSAIEFTSPNSSTDMDLIAAIRVGDLADVTALLNASAKVNCRDSEGFTPLLIAAGLGRAPLVELLLAAGADVFVVEPRMGATALHKAAQSGSISVIQLLLKYGSFIDQQSPVLGNTPLMDAVVYKHEEAVRLLLDRGAKTILRNYWQQTALELAQHDNLTSIARLIEVRNETDAAQVDALKLLAAVKVGDLEKVEQLLAAGINANERAPLVGSVDDNYTPLGVAVREGHSGIARVLSVAGADPGQKIGLMHGTSVHEAAYFGRDDVVRVLTEKPGPAGPSVLDAQGPYNGFTALHDAAWHGHLEAARALVKAGARLDLLSHAGQTPRELAAGYGYDRLAQFLADSEREYEASLRMHPYKPETDIIHSKA